MLGEGMGGGGVTGAAGCAVLLCYLKPRGPMILGAGMGGGGSLGLEFQLKYIRLNYRPVRDVEELG